MGPDDTVPDSPLKGWWNCSPKETVIGAVYADLESPRCRWKGAKPRRDPRDGYTLWSRG